MQRLIGGTMVGMLCVSVLSAAAYGEVFVHNFDMDEGYTEYLHSVENASVFTENYWPDGPTIYWKPDSVGVWGHVTYRYELPFVIEQASVYANILAISGSAQTHLDVSPDGTNWTTVASGYIDRPSLAPIDVSDILRSSATAYVRGSIYVGSGSTIYAQFLRTTANIDGWHQVPYVYNFEATDVPEPASLLLLLSGFGGLMVRFRQRQIQ